MTGFNDILKVKLIDRFKVFDIDSGVVCLGYCYKFKFKLRERQEIGKKMDVR